MRVFTNRYRISEQFPVQEGEQWVVRQQDRVAEHWRVVQRGKTYFTAEITEYFEK